MKKIWAVALLALACLTFTAASSAEEQEWQLFTPEGTYLTWVDFSGSGFTDEEL